MENEDISPARCTYDEWRLTKSASQEKYIPGMDRMFWLSLADGPCFIGLQGVMISYSNGLAGSGGWLTCFSHSGEGALRHRHQQQMST